MSKYCRSGHFRLTAWWGLGIAALLILSSCNSKKNLLDHQSFLMSNKVKIKSDHPIHSKADLSDNLVLRYLQPQTKYAIIVPRHVNYYRYQQSLLKNPDRKKWDAEREIKNRPVIYDSLKAAQTAEDMQKYMALRGYRSNEVHFESKTSNKKTKVTYHVNAGPRLIIDTFSILTKDSAFQQIINEDPSARIIQPGDPLDVLLYNQERARIVRLLQNHGYATFDESFIPQLEIDTSEQKVRAVMRLKNPSDSTYHEKYRIGDIKIYPDYDLVAPHSYHDTIVQNIQYFLPDTNVFTLKPDIMRRSVFLNEGDYTNRDNLDKSIRNLGKLEIIKFVTPSALIDTSKGLLPAIDYTFLLTRNKKINFDINGELTYSNIASQERRSLFGTSFSSTYRDRNIFGNAEILDINAQLGFEFNFFARESESYDAFLNSLNAGLGTNLSFRRFMDPLKIYSMIGHRKDPDKKPLLGARLHQWLMNESSSRLSMGFNYVRITELYSYLNFNANLNYDIQPSAWQKLTIIRTGLDIFLPTATDAYQDILDANKFLAQSFGNQLFTGFLFRNYLFEVNSKNIQRDGRFRLLHSVELSGLEMYAINRTANLISGNKNEIVLNPGATPDQQVQFSQFIKAEIDLRYYHNLARKTQFAVKLNTGVASRYGIFTKQVPYPKQFYVGGALSNRAWQIRELGPGGYEDLTVINPNLPFYQTGDFKIDFSAELRFPLFWYFYGVTFIDAANVWTIQNDPSRPGAVISKNFYKEIGIGYGYGIRLDVDFFILRLDLGYKLHNPYPVNGSRWLIDEVKRFPKGAEPQIAVGLPF
jgi:outer membrane protein assembly factor BamA